MLLSVNYAALDMLIQMKGISRRKLAFSTGIDEGTLAGSFRRHSKMKHLYILKIADYFNVNPITLLEKDKAGNPIGTIPEEFYKYRLVEKNVKYDCIIEKLRLLNIDGLNEVKHFISIISEIPIYQKTGENEDG